MEDFIRETARVISEAKQRLQLLVTGAGDNNNSNSRMSTSISRGMLPLLAIQAVNEYYWLPWKPPVTAALIAANSLIYLRPGFLRPFIPPIDRVWFNPHLILKHRDLRRLLLSAFYHVGDTHLFYNMTSLLWKGVRLETAMGSVEFASMVATLVALSQGITLLLARSLLIFFDYDRPFYYEYAAGFSGVLFAMKVVLNSMTSRDDDVAFVQGLVVPAKYAAWAELVLVQMFVPGVSFWGHLGGVLAGIAYVKLRRWYSGSDPLGALIRGALGVLTLPVKFVERVFGFWWSGRGRGRISGRGSAGGGSDRYERAGGRVWRCGVCTFDNAGWSSECEMCGSRHGGGSDDSWRSSRQSGAEEVDIDEIRRRRIERFDR